MVVYGIAVILILKFAVLRYHRALRYAQCGFSSFWVTVFDKRRSFTVIYGTVHFRSPV